MYRFISVGVLFVLLVVAIPSHAGSPYDDELLQYSGQLQSLMLRSNRPGASEPKVRTELYRQLFQLSKRLHRLQEEAMATNLQLQRSGQPRDRGLTFAAQIAQSLDLAQSDTVAYLHTKDRAFLAAAKDAAKAARELMAEE